jgi:hypothetical protein
MSAHRPDRAADVADSDRPATGLAALGPTWQIYLEYWRMVRRHVPDRKERLRCYTRLIGWLVVNRNALRLLLEPAGSLDLRPGVRASEFRQRLLVGARVTQLRQR